MELDGVPRSEWKSSDNFYIRQCREQTCPCILIIEENDNSVHGMYPITEKYNQMLNCECTSCEGLLFACNVHAKNYLIHTKNDFWLCKECYKKENPDCCKYYRKGDDDYEFENDEDEYIASKELCQKVNCCH